ncbi:MAG: hypothetical protein C4541_00805, partial [Candidatus Auribacter fodinae]
SGASYYAGEGDAVTGALLGNAVFGVDFAVFSLATGEFLVDPALTIQAAVDAAAPGDTVNVRAAVYTESVTVGKSLNLLGPNAGVNPNTEARSAEAVIQGASTPITVAADEVTIDGLTITNANGTYAISSSGYDDLIIQNNIITDVGTNYHGASCRVHAVVISGDTAPADNIVIRYNEFYNLGNFTQGDGSQSGSTSAIGFVQNSSANKVTNVTIQDNHIYNVKANTGPWGAGGWGGGANGVMLGLGAGVENAVIWGNVINNLEGLWASGIGLECPTLNANVQFNVISDLRDHKDGGGTPVADNDANGVKFENNAHAATVTLANNQFSDCEVGVRNVTGILVNAEFNWWGAADGPSDVGGGDGIGSGVGVWENVDFTPWLNEDVLWVRSEATDGSEDFEDVSNSAHDPVTGHNGIAHAAPVGSDSAIYFDGINQYLSIADSTDWDLGTGDFTVDCWVNFSSEPVDLTGLLSSLVDGSHNGYRFEVRNGNIRWQSRTASGWYTIDTGVSPGTDTWYHLAAVRSGGTLTIYVNGENKGYLTSLAGVSFDSDNGLVIGRIATGTDDFYLHGHMDEVRVNKGTARWDAAFTPPLHPDPAP